MTDKMILGDSTILRWSEADDGRCGCNGCCNDEGEFGGVVELTSENMAENIAELDEEYYGIFDEGHISPWKKESTG